MKDEVYRAHDSTDLSTVICPRCLKSAWHLSPWKMGHPDQYAFCLNGDCPEKVSALMKEYYAIQDERYRSQGQVIWRIMSPSEIEKKGIASLATKLKHGTGSND